MNDDSYFNRRISRVLASNCIKDLVAETELVERLTAKHRVMEKRVRRQRNILFWRSLPTVMRIFVRITMRRLHYVWFKDVPNSTLRLLVAVHYGTRTYGERKGDTDVLLSAAAAEFNRRFPARVGLPSSMRSSA